jgi:hypothetical protein
MSKMRRIIKNKSKAPSELKETKGKGFFKLAAAPASGSRYQKPRAAKTKAMLAIKYTLNLKSEKKIRQLFQRNVPRKIRRSHKKWRPQAVIQVHLKRPFSRPTHINKRSFTVVAF